MRLLQVPAQAPASRPPSPFLKWAGGKTQLLNEIVPRMPAAFGTYFEPFLGGGAVFFRRQPKRAVLGDLNPELVNVYQVVKTDPEGLQAAMVRHSRHKLNSDYFYKLRQTSPQTLTAAERAARMIFLNKTCFNGLWRVNSKGEFNVPWGGYANPMLLDAENLAACHQALRQTKIHLADYRQTLAQAKEGDFVYLDPPYSPVSKTAAFTGYTKEEFSDDDQRALASEVHRLTRRGVRVLLSNSRADLTEELYGSFRIDVVKAKRAINCNGSKRGPVDELLVRNYEE